MHQVIGQLLKKRDTILAVCVFSTVWCLYALSAAPGTVYGDPSEYQFIPAIWGIAHPPGYAFYIVLAGVWQRLFPVGSVAFRTNLLAGAAGAWTVSRVVLMVSSILRKITDSDRKMTTLVIVLVGAGLAISPDLWQHSIHANAHIVSVALTSTQLWLLIRWSEKHNNVWLFACAFFCGIGVTHHPITIWGLPAYALYILIEQPRFIKQPKIIFTFILCGVLGLAPLLYFLIRSPNVAFGPTDMRTWAGFLRHATAQGLRVNLFHYGLADILERWTVFMSLLRLQYAMPFLFCLVLGSLIFVKKRLKEGYLIAVFLVGHLAFTLNSVQDVMAYLLNVFMALAIPMALGCAVVLQWWRGRSTKFGYNLTLTALFLLVSVQLASRFPLISLKNWHNADNTVHQLIDRFKDKAQNAAYVADWEHLTPYYYYTLVEGVTFDANDVLPVYVTGDLTRDQAVFTYLPRGPVYLSNYRREIRDLGFRLRPVDQLWQVLEPPALEPVTPEYILTDSELDEGIQIIGYDLPERNALPGDVIPFTLYTRSRFTQTDILMPYINFGLIEQRWTTDSRRLTPQWLPNEIIVEQYDIYIPHSLDPNTYTLTLRYANMSRDNVSLLFSDGSTHINLGELTVQSLTGLKVHNAVLERSLTNIGNDICLVTAHARTGTHNRYGIWTEPLLIKQDKALHLDLSWYAVKHPRMSYTVFIHLIDSHGVPHYGHDYTPLGGAFPTFLWFPKWLPGQQVKDPYKLIIPADISPGMYWLEVGMYEMGSIRRIPLLDKSGSMTGDRLILGPVLVEPIDS